MSSGGCVEMNRATAGSTIGPRPDLPGSSAWRYVSPLFGVLLLMPVAFALFRLLRPDLVVYYTEANVLGSLAALEGPGGLGALYPADGWVRPPIVLTLYPPLYFWVTAAIDAVTGMGGSLLAPRIVSTAGLAGSLILLVRIGIRSRAPGAWIVSLLGAAMLAPPLYPLAGAAQVHALALFWTAAGITLAFPWIEGGAAADESGATPPRGLPWAAILCFLFAFFTKQDFVTAPAAVAIFFALTTRVRLAVRFSAALLVSSVIGTLILDRATAGGYLANTFGALSGGLAPANFTAALASTAPLQWLPIAVVVALAVRGRTRAGFPELYLAATAALHLGGMARIGSSSNYFTEPLFALLLLGFVRSPARGVPGTGINQRLVAVLAVVLLAPAAIAGVSRFVQIQRLANEAVPTWDVAATTGYPLVEWKLFPAVLARGELPYLNDTFAFGAMYEAGKWDIEVVASAVDDGRIPYAISHIDPRAAPASPDARVIDHPFSFFWTTPRLWESLHRAFRPRPLGIYYLWTAEATHPLTVRGPR